MAWVRARRGAELEVPVVGLQGVGKTTLLLEMEAKQREYENRSDFQRDYVLNACCAPTQTATVEKVKFVFKEVYQRRMWHEPMRALVRDGIVIIVYNAWDERSYKDVHALAKAIQVLCPETIFFFLGNKDSRAAPNLVDIDAELPELMCDEELADSIKLYVRAKSFRTQEFLDAFLDKFLQISYHKFCVERGVPVGQPESVYMSAKPGWAFRIKSCSII